MATQIKQQIPRHPSLPFILRDLQDFRRILFWNDHLEYRIYVMIGISLSLCLSKKLFFCPSLLSNQIKNLSCCVLS